MAAMTRLRKRMLIGLSLLAVAVPVLAAESSQTAAETSYYDGPVRFAPILNMNFKPFHKNGLIGSSRTQFFSPAFNNTPSQAEAKSLQNRNEFDLIGCEYGTKQSSDTPETDSVRVYFWLDKRATLSDLAVQQLQDYRRDHYLLVDVAVKRCPASYWDVLDIVKNPLLASRVQESFDKLHAEGRKAGFRFVSPMFGNIYDFADSLATKGSRGYYRSTTHSAEGFFSEKSPPAWFLDYKLAQAERPNSVRKDIETLIQAKQEILECVYSGNYLRAQGLPQSLDIFFWKTKRPARVGDALANWLETVRYPLIDSAVDECPLAAGLVTALAQGITGQAATDSQLIARNALDSLINSARKNCGFSKDISEAATESRLGAPSAREMCDAFFSVKQVHAAAVNPLAPGGASLLNQVVEMLYPNGYIKDSSVRASKSLYEMVGVYLGGNYQYQIQQFDKVGCSKISVDTFKCTFYLKATLSSEVAVAGMVPVVKSIEGRKTGTFVRRTGRWEYQLPN